MKNLIKYYFNKIINYLLLMKSKFLKHITKNIFYINFFLLYISLTSQKTTQLSETIPIEVTLDFKETKTEKSYQVVKQKYIVMINESSTIPNYIEINSSAIDNSNVGQYIYFSSYDPECMEGREQLAQGVGLKTKMFIKKEQIKSNKFYIVVECKLDDSCNFAVTFSGLDKIKLSEQEQYTYYVSKNNTQMEFSINSVLDTKYITIYTKGYKNINTIQNLNYSFDQGKAIIIENPNNSFSYSLTVNGEEGDLITVGNQIVKKNDFGENEILNGITPNRFSYYGLLKKNYNEEECYKIELNDKSYNDDDNLYIEGYFYGKIGSIYFRDSDFKKLTDTTQEYKNGNFHYTFSPKLKYSYICVSMYNISFATEMNYLIYNIQLNDRYKYISGLSNNVPLTLGNIYTKTINLEDYTHYSSFLINNTNNLYLKYKLFQNDGYPKMYIHECQTYPKCLYHKLSEQEKKNLTISHKTHEIYSETVEINENINSAIHPKQNMLVVYCENVSESNSSSCSYDILITSEESITDLREEKDIEEYLQKYKQNKYLINFENEKSITKIIIDVIIINGNVNLTIEDKNIIYSKYDETNKISYVINTADNSNLNKIIFSIFALKNTYYSVRYSLHRDLNDRFSVFINSGFSYNIFLDPEDIPAYKILHVKNNRKNENKNFTASFYSLNCVIDVKKLYNSDSDESLEFFDHYAQDILETTSPYYNNEAYLYNVSVSESIESNYTSKMCMFYVYGYEITLKNDNNLIKKEIVISENIPQQVIFANQMQTVRYLYPLTDLKKNIHIRIFVIDETQYTFNITFDSNPGYEYEISSSTKLFLENNEWSEKCKNTVCNIIIEITLKNIIYEPEPMLEFCVEMEDSFPFYFLKQRYNTNYFTKDKNLYFYGEIGENEEGKIKVNFYKAPGKIYAKIINKNQIKKDEAPIWRETNNFPTSEINTLEYTDYLQEVSFTKNDTKGCYNNGCLLLITIKSSIDGSSNLNKIFYPFNMLVVSSTDLTNNYPLCHLLINQYIVDNVICSNKKIENYKYYYIWLLREANYVQIEFQHSNANLLVNIGDEKPTKNKYDFSYKFIKEENSLIQISKEDILECAKKKGIDNDGYLMGIKLTIGVWSEKDDDNLSYSTYVLKLYLAPNDLNIYEIKTGTKAICSPSKISDSEYRCLFVVFYDNGQYLFPLMLYPLLSDNTVNYNLYGNFINKEEIETNNIDYLKNNIPNKENSEFNIEKNEQKYLYINNGQLNKHLYLSLILNKNTTVELFSSYYPFTKLLPISNDKQLFSLNEDKMEIGLQTKKNMLLKLNIISGEGIIYWEDNENNILEINSNEINNIYINRGISQNYQDFTYHNLIVKNSNQLQSLNNSKFSFIFDYQIHPVNVIYGEIPFNKMSLLSYNEIKLPINLYSIIENFDNDLNLIFNLRESYSTNNLNYNIKGIISNYSLSYNEIKMHDEINKSQIKGVYDPVTKVASLLISKEIIQNAKKNIIDTPTLYFSINEQNENNALIINSLKAISYTISENSDIEAEENKYYYGKLSLDTKINSFKLKINDQKKYMLIQFNTNGNNSLNWSINSIKGNNTNITFSETESKKYGGLDSFIFQIPENTSFLYLNIFHMDNSTNEQLCNYAFKYGSFLSKENMSLYTLEYNKFDLKLNEKENNNYLIEINPITILDKYLNENITITYLIKIIDEKDYIKEEKKDCFALTESKKTVIEKINPVVNENKKIKFNLNINEKRFYISVIGYIKINSINEYVLYEGYNFENNSDLNSNSSKKTLIICIVCIFVILIALVLILLIIRRNKKKGSGLVEDVKKLQDTEPILMNNDEELKAL